MKPDDYIDSARTHLRKFLKVDSLTPEDLKEFRRAQMREAVIVSFAADGRDDKFEITLDRETGAFIGGSYSPKKQAE